MEPIFTPTPDEYLLTADLVIPAPLSDVFGFFSRPENLGLITPPWLEFRVLTPSPVPMHEGAIIDYRIRMRAIPMRWRTRILEYRPNSCFIDEQLRGP